MSARPSATRSCDRSASWMAAGAPPSNATHTQLQTGCKKSAAGTIVGHLGGRTHAKRDAKEIMEARTAGDDRRPRVREVWASLDGGQRRTLALMAVVVVGLHVARLLDPGRARRAEPLPPRHGGDVHGRDRGHRLHARAAPRVRRRSHLRDRQHDPQADVRGQAAAVASGSGSRSDIRTIVFALAFLISVGVRSLDGPRQERQLAAAPGDELDRDRRLRRVPLPHRRAQRRDPRQHHEGVPRDADAAPTTRRRWRRSSTAAA